MKTTLLLSGLLAVSTLAFGQTRATFEVASIKPSPPMAEGVTVGVHIDGSQVRIAQMSLKDYIAMAYRIKTYQIKSPDWLASERFDIAAKLPDGAPSSKVREMVQSLLEDRFQMKLHHSPEDFLVYALVVDKGGLKMTPSVEALPADDGIVNIAAGGNAGGLGFDMGKGSTMTFADNKLVIKKLSMLQIADSVGRLLDRPLIDMTGLKGGYDMELDVTPEDYRAMLVRSAVNAGVILPPQAMRLLDAPSDHSLADALESVGLRMDSRKAPLDVLVIDNILKAPVEP